MATSYRPIDEVMEAIERIKMQEVHELPESMEERDRLLKSVCRTAAQIEASKIAAGMSPSEPAPWPESTWEFMRFHARKFQQQGE